MELPTSPLDDDVKIRCPRLGHQINFAYCRVENHGLPCFKSLDCWYQYFQVEAYLRGQLTGEQWDSVFSKPPQPKMLSLLEMIEQARKSR